MLIWFLLFLWSLQPLVLCFSLIYSRNYDYYCTSLLILKGGRRASTTSPCPRPRSTPRARLPPERVALTAGYPARARHPAPLPRRAVMPAVGYPARASHPATQRPDPLSLDIWRPICPRPPKSAPDPLPSTQHATFPKFGDLPSSPEIADVRARSARGPPKPAPAPLSHINENHNQTSISSAHS